MKINLPKIMRFLPTLRFPLFWQMLSTMATVMVIATGSLWLFLQFNLDELLKKQTDTFAHTITQQAANSSAELLMADDTFTLSSMLDNLVRTSINIHSIHVYDDKQKVVAKASRNTQSKFTLSYGSDIIFHNVKAGYIHLSIDNSAIRNSLINSQKILGIVCAVVGLLAFIFTILIARKLTNPLKELQTITQTVASGNLNPDMPKAGNDEVGDLINSFKNMLQGLRDKKSIEYKFNSYLSKDIAKDILSDLDQHKRPLKTVNGSVLFVDIVGFTQLSESENPQIIADILDQYYSLLHQISKLYWGSVDNYIGDGAMLTFGVHVNDPKHSIHAICAAQVFIRLTKDMNLHRQQAGLPTLEFRLGLHCGEMLAGTIGSKERMQFTISGDTVNLAARLCDLAKADSLLISSSIYDHPACQDLLISDTGQSFTIKGKTDPITAFHVTALAAKFNRILMQQEHELRAMQKYA